jgi:hypothetical protein
MRRRPALACATWKDRKDVTQSESGGSARRRLPQSKGATWRARGLPLGAATRRDEQAAADCAHGAASWHNAIAERAQCGQI